jgi:hypothetical protein
VMVSVYKRHDQARAARVSDQGTLNRPGRLNDKLRPERLHPKRPR